ncbi:MAG: hypothetical protein JXA96_15305 [Sedimentisphaerales bacterium]|nr:hypothetical protein [Sedimentisphaerales bacterium]
MATETTAVHVTHETVSKVGGIGAVLHGFFTSKSYLEAVGRSILVGPLFTTEGSAHERLGENSEVLYSSIDSFSNTGYAHAFHKIENTYNAGIIYGRRTFTDKKTGITSSPEVILIDIRHMDKGPINEFKRRIFEKFGVKSNLFEHLWEYEQYIRIAPVAIEVLKAIGAADDSTVVMSHEFMGMPTVLAAILETNCNFRTIFYAHEVATMRRIVEEHPGHDTMFYNAMHKAHDEELYVNEVMGDQSDYFKHSLVEASKYCDRICAVGDYVMDELRFLAPEFDNAAIDIVYNGIPAYEITIEEKLNSKIKLQKYCENLLGYRPDYIFTHVTRLVRSKGMWRDLRVLEHMDKEFLTQGKTAVLFVLSTEVGPRRSQDIYQMETDYKWPIAHREGWPDLSGGEANYYTAIQEFNAKSRNIKVIFINQFGFEPKKCGHKMPDDMEFMDIRRGSDVEFGQSIYEPFGIAQLEPLTFGGICVFTNVCGCAGFLRDTTSGVPVKNAIVANYTDLAVSCYDNLEDILQINRPIRDKIEANESKRVAMQICSRLPKNDDETEELLKTGYELARKMSWDIVVQHYVLPGLHSITEKLEVV